MRGRRGNRGAGGGCGGEEEVTGREAGGFSFQKHP